MKGLNSSLSKPLCGARMGPSALLGRMFSCPHFCPPCNTFPRGASMPWHSWQLVSNRWCSSPAVQVQALAGVEPHGKNQPRGHDTMPSGLRRGADRAGSLMGAAKKALAVHKEGSGLDSTQKSRSCNFIEFMVSEPLLGELWYPGTE